VWTLVCWWRPLLCEQNLPHNVQLYGFSPVWTLICWVSRKLRANDLLQNWQLYGFSPVWHLKWMSSVLFLTKVLLHCWQLNILVFMTAGKFCSIALSAFALSPSCSFLQYKKTFLKRQSHKLLMLFVFVSTVQVGNVLLQADKFHTIVQKKQK
jgi:hypothetical protein